MLEKSQQSSQDHQVADEKEISESKNKEESRKLRYLAKEQAKSAAKPGEFDKRQQKSFENEEGNQYQIAERGRQMERSQRKQEENDFRKIGSARALSREPDLSDSRRIKAIKKKLPAPQFEKGLRAYESESALKGKPIFNNLTRPLGGFFDPFYQYGGASMYFQYYYMIFLD